MQFSYNFGNLLTAVKQNGSTRPLAEVIHLADVILEQNDYHAFGGRIENANQPKWESNRYGFNGKENLHSPLASLNLTDYGARMYSSPRARWTTPDPLADKYFSTSPYAFCGNNPVNLVDPDGKAHGDPIRDPEIRKNRASNLYGEGIRVTEDNQPRNHQGFDYYAPVGTNVMAVKDGKVIKVETGHKSYGTSITIEHVDRDGKQVYSFYAHLSKVKVETNDIVTEGQVIAESGVSGNAENLTGTDQHLHFELRTQPDHALGLIGKSNPNEIVDTKFESQNPSIKPQSSIGIIKIHKDGKKEIRNYYH